MIKKFKKLTLLTLFGAGIVFGTPVVPVETEWVKSYEGLADETLPETEWENAEKAYYHIFLNDRKEVKVKTTKLEYDKLKDEKAVKPKHKIRKNILSGKNVKAVISHDASSSSSCNTCSSLTFAHTVTAGSNLALISGSSWGTGTSATMSSTKYNNISLTSIDNSVNSTLRSELLYLVAPSTGSNNIVVTLSGTVRVIASGGHSYAGVDQSSTIGATNTGTGSGTTTISESLTTTVANSWVIDVCGSAKYGSVNATFTPGANQTERWDVGNYYPDTQYSGCGTDEVTVDTGSVTMSETISNVCNYTHVLAEMKEAVISPSAPETPRKQNVIFFN